MLASDHSNVTPGDCRALSNFAHNDNERLERNRRRNTRDAILRRTLEVYVFHQMENFPLFRARFERLLTETDPDAAVGLLFFRNDVGEHRMRKIIFAIQKRLGLPDGEYLSLEDAVAVSLPFWRRGSITRSSRERMKEIGTLAERLITALAGLSPKRRNKRYRLFASSRGISELIFDGAVDLEELEALDDRRKLVDEQGPRVSAYEIVAEARYRILRKPSLIRS